MRQYLFVAVLLLVSLSLVSGVSAAAWNKASFNISNSLAYANNGGNYEKAYDNDNATYWQGITTTNGKTWNLIRLQNQSAFNLKDLYIQFYDKDYSSNISILYGSNDNNPSFNSGTWAYLGEANLTASVIILNTTNTVTYKWYLNNMTTYTHINNTAIKEYYLYGDQTIGPEPITYNLTVRVNNTRTGDLVAGFSWNYTTTNGSDAGPKSGYCNTQAGCSLTNYSGTVNVTAFNISAGTYFNPASNISFAYNASAGATMTFHTYQNSLMANMTNVVNNSAISSFCMNVSNSTSSQSNCTSAGSLTFYLVSGNTTILYYNVSNGTYFNVSQNIGLFNATLTNFTNSTYQSMLIINATQLYTGLPVATFNVTNWLLTNSTTSGQLSVKANAGANNIKIDVPGNYSKNISCTVTFLQTAHCNISGIHDGLFKINATNRLNNSAISSFSINAVNTSLFNDNYATSNGTVYIPLLQGYDYSFLINASGYALQNITLRSNTTQNNYSFSLYRAQTIELLFKDELTRANINGTVTIQMISDSMAANYTTSNATLYVDLLLPDVYTFLYQPTGYLEREYTTNIASQSYNNITLYSITYNDSGTARATVVDTGGTPVEGATVKLMRYYVYCNCYEVVESGETSASGEIYFNAQFYDGYYKWSVDYNGVNYFLSTSPESLVPNDGETMVIRVFTINLGEDYYDGFTGLSSVGTSCTYNSGNGGLSFTWSDPNGHTSQGCLNAEYLSGVHYATYANTCVQGSTGSIVVTLNNTNTTRYLYTATLVIDGQSYQADSCTGWIEPSSGNHFGVAFGAFIAGGIIITLVMIFSYSAIAVLVISTIGIIFVSALGLMTFSTAFIGGLVVMVLGIGIYLMRS